MSDVTFLRSANLLDAYGRQIPVANNVRLNRDGTGPRTRAGIPYVPQAFPVSPATGWRITGVFPRTDPHLAPFYIATNAWRLVPEWTIDPVSGKFLKVTGRMVYDDAYGIHFSTLDFTQGCIRVIERANLEWLAAQITDELEELRKLDPKQAWISLDAREAV